MLPGRRIQLSTDGYGAYPAVVDALWRGNIDYGVIVKEYRDPPTEEARRYSPATCTLIDKRVISGDPIEDLISTSYVERQNHSNADGDASLHAADQRVLQPDAHRTM